MARLNTSVTIVGRNREAGAAIVKEMQSLSPASTFDFVEMDSSLCANAKALAERVKGDAPLDYLVLTAGIATTQGYTPTAEGLDQKLAVHYFGRVAIAQQLAPLMEGAADPRVLSVLSGGIHSAYEGHATDFDLKNTYSLKGAADAAGFYNDIAADSMHDEHPQIAYLHAAPGFVSTNWGTELNVVLRGLVRFVQLFAKSEETCGQYMVKGLLAPEYKAGFHVLNQEGGKAEVTPQHAAAKASVWASTKAVLARFL